jgi:hypothetical protein
MQPVVRLAIITVDRVKDFADFIGSFLIGQFMSEVSARDVFNYALSYQKRGIAHSQTGRDLTDLSMLKKSQQVCACQYQEVFRLR